MKNSKRKILIASSFAILMLMVPLASAVTDTKTVENLEFQHTEQQLIFKERDSRSGLLELIYTIAEEMVQEVLDVGLNVNENTEVLQAQMQQILASEGYDLTAELNQELIASGQNLMGQDVQDMGVGATSGELSGSSVVKNTGAGIESQATGSKIGYSESYQDIYTYLAGEVYAGFNSEQIKGRLGWINGMIGYILRTKTSYDAWKETWIPNVTWVNIIEDWGDWLGVPIDVEQLFVELEASLLEMFEGHPLIETIIPVVLQELYDRLNTKVGNNLRNLLDKVSGKIRDFIRVWRGKDVGLSPKKIFRRILFWTLLFTLDAWLVVTHCNPVLYPDRWERWEIERIHARANLSENLTKFSQWYESNPWLEPVHINGTVAGCTDTETTQIYCEKDPSTRISVTGNGYFEGLDFYTRDEAYPRGLHICKTTASNSKGTITLGGHSGSGSLGQNILEAGVFSGGNLTVIFDFSGQQGSGYPGVYVVQSQPAQQTTTPSK